MNLTKKTFELGKMSYKFIIFDLETTGLGKRTEICQLAAINMLDDDAYFNVYTLPKGKINHFASAVNGLKKMDGQLYFRQEPVQTSETRKSGFYAFAKWLNDQKDSPNDEIVLIGHNSFRFDAPVLINNMSKEGLKCDFIHGFIDTLDFFKQHYPELKKINLKFLMGHFGLQEDQTHEGLQDTRDLKEVLQRALAGKDISFLDFVSENIRTKSSISLK